MKLAFLAQSYPPMVSGAAIFAKRLADGMAERGHQVLVIAASDRDTAYLKQTDDLSEFHLQSAPNPFRVGQRFMLPGRRQVLRALEEFQPALIHTHDAFQLGLTGAAHARRRGIPTVLSVHALPGLATSYIPDLDSLRARAERLLWKYARWLLQKFDAVTTPTRTIANIVAERTGIQPQTVSNGIDLRAFTLSPSRSTPLGLPPDVEQTLRHRLGLPPRVPVLLHVGRLDTEKSVGRVIRAAAQTMQMSDAHLLLVGDGCEKPALMDLCNSLGIAKRVHFPGFITLEQGLPDVYRLADLFVTASEIETQGIVLLEAAASGLPIAAVRATCIPEIVHHKENGFLSEPGDINGLAKSMTSLLQNPTMAKQMGQASHRLAQAHDQQRTIGFYEELYSRLITEKIPSPLEQEKMLGFLRSV